MLQGSYLMCNAMCSCVQATNRSNKTWSMACHKWSMLKNSFVLVVVPRNWSTPCVKQEISLTPGKLRLVLPMAWLAVGVGLGPPMWPGRCSAEASREAAVEEQADEPRPPQWPGLTAQGKGVLAVGGMLQSMAVLVWDTTWQIFRVLL